jgi:hypothetical protein
MLLARANRLDPSLVAPPRHSRTPCPWPGAGRVNFLGRAYESGAHHHSPGGGGGGRVGRPRSGAAASREASKWRIKDGGDWGMAVPGAGFRILAVHAWIAAAGASKLQGWPKSCRLAQDFD